MAIRRVPQDYPSVQAAANAAVAGDTITVYAAYTTGETVTVAVDNLTFDGSSQAAVTLTLSGVTTIHIGGTLPFSVTSDADGATIYGSVRANTITGGDGVDKIYAGLGDTVRAMGGNDIISVSGKPVVIDGGEGRVRFPRRARRRLHDPIL